MRALGERLSCFEVEGTVFGVMNKKQFYALPVDENVRVNTEEIRCLAHTHDTLLSKLISGEPHMKDAEKLVESVL